MSATGGVSSPSVTDAPPSALAERIRAAKPAYLAATPYPHLVLDDALPAELAHALSQRVAEGFTGPLTRTRGKLLVKNETSSVAGAAAAGLAYLESAEMQAALADLTGIHDVMPDPDHRFGGLHETPTGGFTMVHHDFDRHPERKDEFHRINMLLYVTAGWQPDWGGELELWPLDMNGCGARIVPQFNRIVIFETSTLTPHGLPNPVATPDGISRLALASYWYSLVPPPSKKRLNAYYLRPGDGLTVRAAVGVQILKSALPARKAFRRLRSRLAK